MKIKFNVKIDEDVGIIYERPIFKVHGSFNEEELDEFIDTLSKDIKEHVSKYITKSKRKDS